MTSTARVDDLQRVLDALGAVAVAVSGGVDSLTLGTLAHRTLGADRVELFHAVSPAVPAAATALVRELAEAERWRLQVVDAGEFGDPSYVANPANRCYFCKTDLYGAIAGRTQATVVSGTNADDLGDYRPGLQAAAEHGVRHPYVEAGFDKGAVRALARELGLGHVADLPAAPCLSSRIETGIAIDAGELRRIDAIETELRELLQPEIVRCRLRADGIVVELDAVTFDRLSAEERRAVVARAGAGARVEPYRRGSAFLRLID